MRQQYDPDAPTHKCPKCKLLKLKSDFPQDKSKAKGFTTPCKACRREYNNKEYYPANRTERIKEATAYREKTGYKGEKIGGIDVKIHISPLERRQTITAYTKQHEQPPTLEQEREWLERYAKAGILGQAKYINEKPG